MLSSIKAFFEEKLANTQSPENQIASKSQLACAALFIEVMKADYELDDREKSELVSLCEPVCRFRKQTLRN